MSYTLGVNADILLGHESVNGGAAYGFRLAKVEQVRDLQSGEFLGSNVAQTRGVNSPGGVDEHVVTHYFAIMMGDGLADPVGRKREESEAVDRQHLLEVLEQIDEIFLVTRAGAYGALSARGHTLTWTEYESVTLISVRLTGTTDVYFPADAEGFANSVWGDEEEVGSTTSLWGDEETGYEENVGYWR